MSVASVLKGIIGGLAKPITGHLNKRQETKQLDMSLKGKIAEKKLDTSAQIAFSEKEWELLSKRAEGKTWKDEYVTVSVVSIWNIIVLGALAAAFGYPQILEGIKVAILALNETGVDVGLIMKVTIFAALGLYAYDKVIR